MPLQVEQERVAELVLLGVVGAVAAGAAVVGLVAADAVLLELREDVAERLLADLADRRAASARSVSPFFSM